MEIKGKREREGGGIAVLFTETMKESINILISMRKKADVTQPYLFSRLGPHTKTLKGTACCCTETFYRSRFEKILILSTQKR